jgi:hypothetical protein
VIDGIHFDDTPTALVMKRKLSTMPILTGATTDESPARTNDLTFELKKRYPNLSEKDIKNLNKLYKREDFGGDEYERVRTVLGEVLMRCGVRLSVNT